MSSIKQFIEEVNLVHSFYNAPDIAVDPVSGRVDLDLLLNSEAQYLFSELDNNLDPACLKCDGEISRAEFIRRYKFYNQAMMELYTLGFKYEQQHY